MTVFCSAALKATRRQLAASSSPIQQKKKPAQGEVVSVGTGARDESGKLHPLAVKEGDLVLFSKWSGTEVQIDGEELLVVKESDIMGILEGKKAKKAA